ncbi:ornithine carbamoyltransferase [Rouxiella sp. S1S-2]|uniref:ornithine carbamoyltransferase n=1 Tax=Rouxiella sp. S1S-2 TaxID=2653856 RepID=UPI001263EFA8|nr:ornithine carbamoyltransferase [Rouxiella sp. S1S-2]KAB7897622.1 ornithine carbamoyltransferase [Rouxiella sp. S1S-2]
MSIITLNDLQPADILAIWQRVESPIAPLWGRVGWSFEGNGIRTRTTFIQAFNALGLSFIELPNLLKTAERAEDLAGYLDPFYDLYVVRESNHEKLATFAACSSKPVINAMSSQGHPCEVLTDAFFINKTLGPIKQVRICLWGPTTNVFKSWHELAPLLGLDLTHVCDEAFHTQTPGVKFTTKADFNTDVVITDGWPTACQSAYPLTLAILQALDNPLLLPTPPFTVGQELDFDPLLYTNFAGYHQKAWLLPVQKAVIAHLLTA